MTAASSPPPRDGEVCCPQGCVVGGCRTWQAPAVPSEPPAADSPTPGTRLTRCCMGLERTQGACGDECPAAPSPVDATEPPAETPQDDDAAVILELLQRVGGDPDRWTPRQRRAVMHLAARPSADTETLRRVRELADEWRSEGRHGADAIALYAAVDGPR